MTDAKIALLELVEQEANADLVREMLAFAAERIMDMEIEAKTGAPAGTRSADRLNHRNGYRERNWDTRAGRIELAIPAVSLGGPETLVTHPASMSAASLSPAERVAMGIPEGMLRISVGLEHVDDVLADVLAAL